MWCGVLKLNLLRKKVKLILLLVNLGIEVLKMYFYRLKWVILVTVIVILLSVILVTWKYSYRIS